MTVPDPATAYRIRRLASSSIMLAVFGGLWLAWGMMSLEQPAAAGVVVAVCAGAVAASVRLARSAPGPEAPDHASRMRRFQMVNVGQWVVVACVAAVLAAFGRQDALPAAISIIVALHFLPLAHMFGRPMYYATAAVILLVDAAALLAGGDEGPIAAMCGTGAILWATVAVQLASGRRLRAATPA